MVHRQCVPSLRLGRSHSHSRPWPKAAATLCEQFSDLFGDCCTGSVTLQLKCAGSGRDRACARLNHALHGHVVVSCYAPPQAPVSIFLQPNFDETGGGSRRDGGPKQVKPFPSHSRIAFLRWMQRVPITGPPHSRQVGRSQTAPFCRSASCASRQVWWLHPSVLQ
jgi:hypothetical protein